jgi:hypothetical protein
MDLKYKHRALSHAMDFESVYDYSEQYKVSGNPAVWKYMDLSKLESLLKSKAMFFAKPGAFIDPLEGSYSRWDIEQSVLNEESITSREYMKKIQEFSGISCWHMNEYESAGMWDLYLGGKDGVAIKTDYSNLINSIDDDRYRVFSGELQYIDYRKEMTSRNIFDTLFYKRKSFSHENELRLMIIASRVDEPYLEGKFEREGLPFDLWDEEIDKLEEESFKFSHNTGNLVSCNPQKLIDAIYVSPKSSPDIVEKVKVLASELGLGDKVTQSDLYTDFIY